MKSVVKIIALSLVLIFLFCVQLQPQNKENVGKSFLLSQPDNRFGNVPIDSLTRIKLHAKQDNMYKAYLKSKNSKLGKVATIPNWRGWVSIPEDQGSCGDCWVHAAEGVMEAQLHILYGTNLQINLNKAEVDPSCGGGFAAWAESYIENNKVGSEVGSYPNLSNVKWTITSYGYVDGIDAIKAALENGPVTAAFEIYTDFGQFFRNYPTGVYRYDGSSPYSNGHDVVIVSYGSDAIGEYWLCKNSGGPSWGDGGFFKIGFGQCLIESWENTYVTVDQSCFAKIIPNLQSFSNAMSYSWAPNEWAYVNSSTNINSGTTVNIPSGAYLNFDSGVSLTSNGVLNAVGTSNPITFNFSGSGGLVFYGSGSSSSSLNYATINNGVGVTFSTGTAATIRNSAINNCTQGVYIYNSAPNVFNNQIIDPQQNGIYLDASGYSPSIIANTIKKNSSNSTYHNYQGIYIVSNATPSIAHNKIGGFSYGIYSGGGSTTNCTGSDNPNQNNLIVNNVEGMTAGWGSTIYAGYTGRGMYNSVHDNSLYDLHSYHNSYLLAGYDYLGSTPKILCDGTSTLYYTPTLSTDPWNGQTTLIEQKNDSKNNEIVQSFIIPNPIIADSSFTDPSSGLNLEDKGDLNGAITLYMSMIAHDKFPDMAFTELFKLCKQYSRTDILNYFESFSSSSKYYPLVSKLIADNNLQTGQFDEAISTYDNLIKTYPNDYYGINARFQKLFAYINKKNDKASAQQMLTQLNALNLTDPIWTIQIQQAENLLGSSSNNSYNSVTSALKGYAVMNYPNPFNPSTLIQYQLPKDGVVTLKVFDILGREIKTLVDRYKTQGTYTVPFDASKLASGIYFYQLRSGNFISTKKMLLMK